MVKLECLFEAFYDCLDGKSGTPDALEFQSRLLGNMTELCDSVNGRTYTPLPSIGFIVPKPVRREVFAANFRDRIIHHYIAIRLEPLFEQEFNDRTYNCRKGKGQLYGIRQLEKDIRECSKDYTVDCWYLQCDLQGFFMSIPRAKLADKVDMFIVERYMGEDKEDLRYMSRETIMHEPHKHCVWRSPRSEREKLAYGKSLDTAPPGCGVAIGNLTSQHNANFYLSPFDWLLEIVFAIIYHGRYVDDFYGIHPDKEYLKECIPKMRAWLKTELSVTLHPRKIRLQPCRYGIKFTGMVVKWGRVYPGKRLAGNFANVVRRMNRLPENYTPRDLDGFVSSLNSYLGLMRHCDSYAIRRKVLGRMDSRFMRELYISGHYEIVVMKRRYREREMIVKRIKEGGNIRDVLDDCCG